jgi:hypothetical protein
MLLFVNAAVCGLLAFIWTKKEPVNVLFKLGFTVLWMVNTFYWLQEAGYVVKG